MRAKEAKQISLIDLLQVLGFTPVKSERGGQERKFISPLRPKEKEPSFNVNLLKNSWYDFGAGEGGNTLDFAIAYLSSLGRPHTVKDALGWLDINTKTRTSVAPLKSQKKTQNLFSFSQQTPQGEFLKNSTVPRKLKFLKSKAVEHPAILNYLEGRRIPKTLVDQYLEEIEYENRETGKRFFAFGMKNESGGYEIRSASTQSNFKSSLIANDVTQIKGISNEGIVNVFEGMTDYLSLLVMFQTPRLKGHSVIMHSLSFYKRTAEIIEKGGYTTINTFLDNNSAGKKYTDQFLDQFKDRVVNQSPSFYPHEDLNNALCAGANPAFAPPPPQP